MRVLRSRLRCRCACRGWLFKPGAQIFEQESLVRSGCDGLNIARKVGAATDSPTAVLAVISLIMFFVHLRHRASRRIALLALVLSLAAAAVAGFGVLAQVTNVTNECAGLVKGSPEHLSCYQDNYSPFRGLAQALIG